MSTNNIQYSDKYYDDVYEYRHVVLPQDIASMIPKDHLLDENEWRGFGIQQSRGWEHYAIHKPEPHIMLFRRVKNYQQIVEEGRNPEDVLRELQRAAQQQTVY